MATAYSQNVPGAKKYNPLAYVPGGATQKVAEATQLAGWGGTLPNPYPQPIGPSAAPAVTSAPRMTKAATPGFWNIPDYNALLAGDWEPDAAAIQGKNMRDTAQADFQKQLRTAFIDFGGDPSKLSTEYSQYIDAPTIEAAKANKFSQTAQNLAAMTKSMRQARAARAAKGMTFSGGSTEDARLRLEARELADVEAGRTFTSGAATGLRGLGTVETQIADLIRNAKAQAAARIAQQYPQTWNPGTEAEYADVPAAAPAAPVPVAPRPAAPHKETAWERALRLRGEAMNKRYGLG